eukprot:3720406-Rhodomonas_salina.1
MTEDGDGDVGGGRVLDQGVEREGTEHAASRGEEGEGGRECGEKSEDTASVYACREREARVCVMTLRMFAWQCARVHGRVCACAAEGNGVHAAGREQAEGDDQRGVGLRLPLPPLLQ